MSPYLIPGLGRQSDPEVIGSLPNSKSDDADMAVVRRLIKPALIIDSARNSLRGDQIYLDHHLNSHQVYENSLKRCAGGPRIMPHRLGTQQVQHVPPLRQRTSVANSNVIPDYQKAGREIFDTSQQR
ncbi:hypothetical protein E4U13_000338 [Claviceps humidiphila]|uniref:Uncharacterized protein n=1 Tax=Claviceps humidiphila TaxID=1294629 RepID=A0A9P7Q2R8_9HYPO|nr:hypothetical protein E4U13_000338 [Claviceps humidiphila]